MSDQLRDIERIAGVLAAHHVDYVIVGGFAVILHGGDTVTQDVDIAFDHSDNNLDRLADALQELKAKPRRWKIQNYRLKITDLSTKWLHMESASGNIDLILDTPGISYSELRDRRVAFDINGAVVLVAAVNDLLKIKEIAGRPKDQLHLAELRTILDSQD